MFMPHNETKESLLNYLTRTAATQLLPVWMPAHTMMLCRNEESNYEIRGAHAETEVAQPDLQSPYTLLYNIYSILTSPDAQRPLNTVH